jgi:SNF2 family DNA or RNA helicase
MKQWTPRPCQPLMYRFALGLQRCALLVPMGFGKTSVILWLIDTLLISGEISKVLILAPLRVARTTWPDEARAWSNFVSLRVVAIVGTEKERLAALATPADVYTCNYDQVVWLIDTLGSKWDFDMVVADEATRLKGFRLRQGTKRAQALAKIIHTKVKRFVALSGTPAPNGLQDLWALSWFIDKGTRLGLTFTAFESRWFGFKRGANPAYAVRVPFPHAQDEIQAKLRDVCLTLSVKDWFDIAEPIVNTIRVTLPPKARQHYREMERDLFTRLSTHDVEAFGAAAKTMKCLQMANGAAYVGDSNTQWEVLHDEKIEALRSVIEEASGAPVMVAYHFRSDLARLQKAFPAARVLDANSKTVEQWNAGEIPILLTHPASAGHGLSLQHGGNILVFYSLNWNLEEHLQVIERIGPVRQKQSGYDRPVFIHYIIADDTIDEVVLDRLHNKRSTQDVLLEALKRYREDKPASTFATD